jgi:chaperonin GroEL
VNTKTASSIGDAPTQKVVFAPAAHEELLKGANILADAVASTMGPSGHSVIIDMEAGPPQITKDGVTVARSICLKDRLQAMGAELLKEIASKTNEKSGDGTTTSTVLGRAMLQEGIKMISSKRSSIKLKKGMDIGTQAVLEFLRQKKIPVSSIEDIVNVGTISANGDRTIGELIAAAIEKVGRDGIITIEPAKCIQTSLEVVEGMQVETGYVSPFFITNSEKATCELDNPYVLITPNKISSIQDILKILEGVAKNNRSLLIIADDVEGDALHTLIVNKTKGVLRVCAIKAPSYGEHRADILSDIQLITGGTVFGATTDVSLKNSGVDNLGSAKKVIVGRNGTTIIGIGTPEQKTAIEKKISDLRSLLKQETLDALHMDKTRKRLAKLSGGIAVIKVGGSTEVEILERKDRVEDAVNATMAAAQEGIIPGGGVALFYASRHLRKLLAEGMFQESDPDVVAGIEIIASVCEAPLRTIVANTGASADVVVEKLIESSGDHKIFYVDVANVEPEDLVNFVSSYRIAKKTELEKGEETKFRYGYNAATGKYGDLVTQGIIDPVKVTRYALEHAASVIGLVLTCNSVVVNEEKKE